MLDVADRTGTARLRERNKQEKRDRILTAARDLFGSQGFDATTMQQVASAARVAAGTLYLYARTKQDLLVMVFVEELGAVVDDSFATLPEDAGPLDALLHLYGAVVAHHAANLSLSRPFAKELMFVDNEHRPQMQTFMTAWRARIAEVLARAQRRGELSPATDTRLLAATSFGLFFYWMQSWVGGHLSRERFDEELPVVLTQLLTGHQTPAV